MTRRSLRRLRRSASLLIAAGLIILIFSFIISSLDSSSLHFDRIVGWSNILAFTLAAAGVAVKLTVPQPQGKTVSPANLDQKVRELSEVVLLSEAQNLRRFTGGENIADLQFAIGSVPNFAQNTGELKRMREIFRSGSGPGSHLNHLSAVARYFHALPLPRMVVLGPPGGGKTVLLTAFIVQSLRDQANHPSVVPVRLDLAGYDPFRSDLTIWLADRIATVYQIDDVVSRRLIETGRVLPVLDGLDEMDNSPGTAERGIATLRKIAAFVIGKERGLILSCREREWVQINSQSDGLEGATVIRIEGLDRQQIQHYISDRLSDNPVLTDSWRPVMASLRSSSTGPLIELLKRPLWLYLAMLTFRGDPTALLTVNDSEDLRARLLAGFVPAVTRLQATESVAGPRYAEADVRLWLQEVARFLNCASAGTPDALDIVPDRLWPIAGTVKVRFIHTAIMSLTTCLAIILGFNDLILGPYRNFAQGYTRTDPGGQSWYPIAAMGVIALLFLIRRLFRLSGTPVSIGRLRLRRRRYRRPSVRNTRRWSWRGLIKLFVRNYRGKLALSAYFAVFIGIQAGGNLGIVGNLSGALFVTACSYMLVSLASLILAAAAMPLRFFWFVPRTARRPYDKLRDDALIGSLFALVAVIFIIAAKIVSPTAWGSWRGAIGLGILAIVAATLISRTTVRYSIAVTIMAVRGCLPLRLRRFLTWAVEAGLLREAGTAYEFRHIELQRWLATRGESDSLDPRLAEPTYRSAMPTANQWQFNAPPNWPAPPVGWSPEPGWQPDPSWPPAPPGWQFWVPAPSPACGAIGERNLRVIPQDVKIAVALRDQGMCVQCGAAEDLHYGNKIPYSRDGSNTINNIQLLCGRCNKA